MIQWTILSMSITTKSGTGYFAGVLPFFKALDLCASKRVIVLQLLSASVISMCPPANWTQIRLNNGKNWKKEKKRELWLPLNAYHEGSGIDTCPFLATARLHWCHRNRCRMALVPLRRAPTKMRRWALSGRRTWLGWDHHTACGASELNTMKWQSHNDQTTTLTRSYLTGAAQQQRRES